MRVDYLPIQMHKPYNHLRLHDISYPYFIRNSQASSQSVPVSPLVHTKPEGLIVKMFFCLEAPIESEIILNWHTKW